MQGRQGKKVENTADGQARDGTENIGEADVRDQFVLSLKQQTVLPIIPPSFLLSVLFFPSVKLQTKEENKGGREGAAKDKRMGKRFSPVLFCQFHPSGLVGLYMSS